MINGAQLIILAFFLLAIYLGIRARRGKDMDLEQWTVGGRGFGTPFVFLLMAGEIYTTFTFLGGSGWAYGKGAAAFYILPYGTLAYVFGYWVLPVIWRYAKDHNVVSQADFFVSKYGSRNLGILVSLVTVVAMIPYLSLQLKGLGIIVSTTSYGTIPSTLAIIIGLVAVVAYVMISGIHGSAWTSVVKDGMVLGVAVFLGLYLPIALHGGFQPMFEQVAQVKGADFLTLSGEYDPTWFITSVVLSALGFYMWPHSFGATLTSRDPKAFRRNAIMLPLYQLILLFVFFVGFAAVLAVPGLQGEETDLALLRVSVETFSPWVVGLVGAAGVLTALVPGSLLLMISATLLVKNVYAALHTSLSEERVTRYAKLTVPVVGAVALYFTLAGGQSIVLLLLLGYSLVTQLFPALIVSLWPNHFGTKYGAAAGILVGVATVTYLTVTDNTLGTLAPWLPEGLHTVHVGIVGLILNAVVFTAVSLATRPTPTSRDRAARDDGTPSSEVPDFTRRETT